MSRPIRKKRSESVKEAADRAERRAKGETPTISKVPVDPIITPAIEVAPEAGAKMGRPTKYKPEFALVASALCKRGATDFELAEEFEVSTVTIWRWTIQNDEFRNAVMGGKAAFDDRVERALAQRALGYTYHSEKVFNFQGEIVRAKTVEHVPADIGAAKLWLTNRKPNEWKEAVQRVESGKPGDFDDMTPDELDAHIAKEFREIGAIEKTEALRAPEKSVKPASKTKH